MTNAIVDTSALVNLGHFAHEMPEDSSFNNMVRVYGGVEFAIEAMIIYDNIYVDGHAFGHHNQHLIDPLNEWFDFIAVMPITAAQRLEVHKSVAKSQISRLANEPSFTDEAAQLLEDYLGGASYISFENFCHSQQYMDADYITIKSAFGEEDFSAICESGLLVHQRNAAYIVITQMLRALFYLELQTMFKCNLVLHPFKGIFVEPQNSIPDTILNIFNREVREERAKLAQKWLGGPTRHFSMPILTQHVLSQLRPGVGLASAINQVRDSKEAKLFREGVSELVESIDKGVASEVNEALAALEGASKAWSTSLGLDPRKSNKKVNLSIPVFGGLGTDIDLKIQKIKLSSSDKILTFVHTLLADDLHPPR